MEYTDGEMFGASDTLLDLPRNAKAVANTRLTMLYINKSQFESLFRHSQDYCFKMIVDARTARDQINSKIKAANKAHLEQ